MIHWCEQVIVRYPCGTSTNLTAKCKMSIAIVDWNEIYLRISLGVQSIFCNYVSKMLKHRVDVYFSYSYLLQWVMDNSITKWNHLNLDSIDWHDTLIWTVIVRYPCGISTNWTTNSKIFKAAFDWNETHLRISLDWQSVFCNYISKMPKYRVNIYFCAV